MSVETSIMRWAFILAALCSGLGCTLSDNTSSHEKSPAASYSAVEVEAALTRFARLGRGKRPSFR